MKQATNFFIHFLILIMLLVPAISLAQTETSGWQGLVSCGLGSGEICDFKAFMGLINTVIRFALFYLAVPISAIMFAYAGFMLITAGEEASSARTKAKDIFTNAVIGLAVAAGAWLVIRTILSILGYDGAWIGF